ncbi:MAG TPA: L-histidine N(alpha)-methyltransferase [Candidatus Angelobacter sp.]|nr:L-histidine N(alpha)-methyltransferase [Candidatus Angelobacter sp.]
MSQVNVAIHSSQFPDAVRRDLVESLRARAVNHKFHYDSVKQTQKWLALHQIHSPSRNDEDCAAIYDAGFEVAAAGIEAKRVHLIGLGCGGGQKDTRLLRLLNNRGVDIFYTPCDVSTAMVLTARQTALSVCADENCFPFVCDLAGADDLSRAFEQRNTQHATRLLTFFGMIPNFEPEMILTKLASSVRAEDWLLFSANLAPGGDYEAGVKKVLPQYDNALTRDWLMTFLLDLGVQEDDGELRFDIEDVAELKRIVARFRFEKARAVALESERFEFRNGEFIRLFFSYRYTAELVRERLERHGLAVLGQWITKSEEEGVFLCRRRI